MKIDFSTERFCRLFRLEMRRDSHTNLMWLAVVFGLLAILAIQLTVFRDYNYPERGEEIYSWYYSDYNANVMLVFFWIGLFLAGCFSASMMMHPIRDKESAIPALMLPASQLEKFAVRWLTYVPAFIVIYIAGFLVIDSLRVLYCTVTHPAALNVHFAFKILFEDKYNILATICGLAAFLSLQSQFVLGSTIWPKRSFLKTFLALCVISSIISVYFTGLFMTLFDDNFYYVPEWAEKFEPTERMTAWFVTIAALIFSSVNYVIAYFRYRESEIIQRW